MGKWWQPEIGDTVWFEEDFEGNIESGKVIGSEVVDQFNNYKMYSVETEYGQVYNLFPTAFTKNKNELVKGIVEYLMNQRQDLDREIAQLERQLTDN